MKNKFICYILLFVSINLYSYEAAIVKPIHENKDSLINLGLNIVKKHMAKKGYELNAYIYKEQKGIEEFTSGNLDWIAIPPSVFFKNEKLLLPHTKDVWTYSLNNNRSYQFYLIANIKNRNVMKNLKKHKITIVELYEPSRYFYYSLLNKRYNKLEYNIRNLDKSNKESKIVYDVFFNKDNLGIISKYSYDVLNELNPQIGRKLKIVAKTPKEILPFIVLQHKSIVGKKQNELLKMIFSSDGLTIRNSKLHGRHILSSIEKINSKELEATRQLYTYSLK